MLVFICKRFPVELEDDITRPEAVDGDLTRFGSPVEGAAGGFGIHIDGLCCPQPQAHATLSPGAVTENCPGWCKPLPEKRALGPMRACAVGRHRRCTRLNTGAHLDGLAELIRVDRVDVPGDDSGGALLRSDVNIGDDSGD